jgi:hypothetical protein
VSAATVAILFVAGAFASMLPTGSWHRISQAADSASVEAAKQPPPAWINRVAPGAADRSAMARYNTPASLRTFLTIWGLAMAVGMVGGAIGTIGWLASMLLVFYASGHWLRRPVANAMDPGVA